GGFAALYPVLRAMEEAGKIRRGYFIDGLGGLQFALPGAVDPLRASRDEESKVVALAATDPASPYGTTIPWPEHESRMARAAGAYVGLDAGGLRLYLERGGRRLGRARRWRVAPVPGARWTVVAHRRRREAGAPARARGDRRAS